MFSYINFYTFNYSKFKSGYPVIYQNYFRSRILYQRLLFSLDYYWNNSPCRPEINLLYLVCCMRIHPHACFYAVCTNILVTVMYEDCLWLWALGDLWAAGILSQFLEQSYLHFQNSMLLFISFFVLTITRRLVSTFCCVVSGQLSTETYFCSIWCAHSSIYPVSQKGLFSILRQYKSQFYEGRICRNF